MAKKVKSPAEVKVDAAAVKSAVEKATKKAAEAAEPVVKKAAEVAEPVVKKVEPVAKKAAEKVEPVVAEVKKSVAKKTTKVTETVFVQFAGKEIDTKNIVAAAKEAYAADHKEAVKDVTVYVKPEDNAAYYVVNGTVAGKVDL